MSARLLGRLLAAYALLVLALSGWVRARYALRPEANGEVVASVWSKGVLQGRAIARDTSSVPGSLSEAVSAGGSIAYESVVASAPLLSWPEDFSALALVAARDGVRARLDGKVGYVTPDDLLVRQAYDHGLRVPALGLLLGVRPELVTTLLAERLGTSADAIRGRATLERVRMRRTPASPERPTGTDLAREDVARAVAAAGRHLARSVNPDGSFRYVVDVTTNQVQPGYNWPRHAGATYFLAQAAESTGDLDIRAACLRAAERMRRGALLSCGAHRCIGAGAKVELGSSALGAIAFAEIVRVGLDDSFRADLAELAAFLRGQQRPDGEFMHEYLRYRNEPVDRQWLYYSSEAVLALARSYDVLHDPADLAAASRGLAYLVGPGWHFFGDRYYYGEEHWTCQAMGDLFGVAPDRKALDFCLRWAEWNGALQQRAGDAPYDADGAVGVGPLVTPRLTPVASRCESAIAAVAAGRAAGVPEARLAPIELQLRRALALLLRHQFVPGPAHLFADPESAFGGFPGSEVDWQLRIDYAQHAGSALVRWLATHEPSPAPSAPLGRAAEP